MLLAGNNHTKTHMYVQKCTWHNPEIYKKESTKERRDYSSISSASADSTSMGSLMIDCNATTVALSNCMSFA